MSDPLTTTQRHREACLYAALAAAAGHERDAEELVIFAHYIETGNLVDRYAAHVELKGSGHD